jgi:two-component system CheB/CheR fusion protein
MAKTSSSKNKSFQIVAIGASSGGLEAVSELLKYLPINTGMAFIVIQHLSPDYKSILTELLAKSTKMKVQEIEDMELMKPNNVYVIPSSKGIQVTDGHIKLTPRIKGKTPNLSIDVLFTSLAETHKEGAIGVVLSGNATDGTLGLRAIKREGGITFAQDNSAKYPSMPSSAINEGVADFILSPRAIAKELSRISLHIGKGETVLPQLIDDNDPALKNIIEVLHKETGVDFSDYKMNTIKRRILRRMFLHKLNTLPQYAKLLGTKANEAKVLYNDLLINVTDFFRDADATKYLKATLLPKLLKAKKPGETLRIWIAACSTGQEAYSFAMLLIEILGKKFTGKNIQIFGSDLSEHAIKKARLGEYTKYEVKGVSPKRLQQFFTIHNGNYRISKQVRDLCAFAPHNLLSDPPFSKLDLISCCNVLIYLNTNTHKKVLTTFHYSLNDTGYLLLSKSESIGTSKLFTQSDKKIKIYSRKKGIRTLPDLTTAGNRQVKAKLEAISKITNSITDVADSESTISNLLHNRFMPAYVVINNLLDIVQFKGDTTRFLTPPTGKATFNILKMARPEIAFELREAITQTMASEKETIKKGVELKIDNQLQQVELNIIPFNISPGPLLMLVVFTTHALTSANTIKPEKGSSAQKTITIKKLRDELTSLRLQLVTVIEEKDKANQVLQEASEEILASNEEFQSMNEEMETSKEEIESANQELITTNQELQTRNEQLVEAHDFSESIVATLHEPMLILDKNLRIKSSNQPFYKKFMVKQAEVDGKLLYELGNHQWDIPRLRELLDNIIQQNTCFYNYEITHVFPNIGKKTMLLNAMLIVQKVKNERLILVAFTDITERDREQKAAKKELEDIINTRTSDLALSVKELAEKNVALEKMNKELETFTFISSHDLQEPLRKIKTFAACLVEEEQANLSEQGKDYLQRLQETVQRMQSLINDLLAYSRVKDGGKSFENVDLKQVLDEALVEFKEVIEANKIVVASKGLYPVDVIHFQFRQLFQNLISNAIKFAAAKRKLHIDIKCQTIKGDKLKVQGLSKGVIYCHISFSDNGIGFDNKYNQRIFEVFQRLHEYEEYKGTGIGLAICKQIVEKHNGIITATGVLNKGARFDIYIPIV